jgi:hypothetical protein
MNDLELLRKYEPVLRFTHGELFFPANVEPYVQRCSLWVRPPRGAAVRKLSPSEVTLEDLDQYGTVEPDHTLYLRFVQRPLHPSDLQRWLRRPDRPHFQAPGRLARVGVPARLTDSAFFLSLLLRGTVPGGTAAAAAVQYAGIRRRDPRFYYYGRVTRNSGYIVLQYLFFYVMNDWRSTFFGANDHEADWEQIFVFLEERGSDPPRPIWLAYATHNHRGDDLRRRWDDPEIAREGDHPVVYVGAGSHASYFEPGEYLTPVELSFVSPVLNAVHRVERVWRDQLGQGDPEKLVERIENILGVPFIDYARGDGLSVGPGHEQEWTPVVISGKEGWVDGYRGLWGLDARDPFAGESAPGGPKYNRDGTVRRSWFDPVGWAGLNKVSPFYQAVPLMEHHLTEVQSELNDVQAEINALCHSLPRLELEVRALQQEHQWDRIEDRRQKELDEGEARLNDLQRRSVDLHETLQACRLLLERLRAGDLGDPEAHIRHKMTPQGEHEIRQNVLAETWAAISTGVLMIGVVAMVGLGIAGWVVTLAFIFGMVLLVESILRRKVINLLVNATIILALITSGVLFYEFFWQLVIIGTIAVATLIIADNIRELWHR